MQDIVDLLIRDRASWWKIWIRCGKRPLCERRTVWASLCKPFIIWLMHMDPPTSLYLLAQYSLALLPSSHPLLPAICRAAGRHQLQFVWAAPWTEFRGSVTGRPLQHVFPHIKTSSYLPTFLPQTGDWEVSQSPITCYLHCTWMAQHLPISDFPRNFIYSSCNAPINDSIIYLPSIFPWPI